VEASETAEKVARLSYSRLVAYLAARWRDLAAAEDAVSDALRVALETWPRTGISGGGMLQLAPSIPRQTLKRASARSIPR
jgi:RNA polymerase sigma-70 factor (ECF subfamily)